MSSPTESVSTEITRDGDCCLVKIRGSLCDDATVTVRNLLLAELEGKPATMVLDCAHVDYISSSGIGMLVSVLKKAHQHGSQLVLCGLNEDLKELFALTRLDQVFPIAASFAAWQQSQA